MHLNYICFKTGVLWYWPIAICFCHGSCCQRHGTGEGAWSIMGDVVWGNHGTNRQNCDGFLFVFYFPDVTLQQNEVTAS